MFFFRRIGRTRGAVRRLALVSACLLLVVLPPAVALAARHEEEVGDDNDPDAEYRRRYHEAQAAT